MSIECGDDVYFVNDGGGIAMCKAVSDEKNWQVTLSIPNAGEVIVSSLSCFRSATAARILSMKRAAAKNAAEGRA